MIRRRLRIWSQALAADPGNDCLREDYQALTAEFLEAVHAFSDGGCEERVSQLLRGA